MQTKRTLLIITGIIFLTFFCSCEKDSGLPDTSKYTVYVAGQYSQDGLPVHCYWKNGERTDFNVGNPGTYNGMYISNGNVYVAGDYSDSEHSYRHVPCFWKNGIKTDLNADNSHEAYAKNIFVSGNDVYSVGYKIVNANSETRTLCYWKNTTCIDITDNPDRIVEATCIFVVGSDVYIGGNYGVFDVKNSHACYWKNGIRTDLPGNNAYVSGIFVENGKVYVSGGCDYQLTLRNENNMGYPCYWADGQKVDLQIDEQYAGISGIFVDNGSIFTAGGRVFSDPYACYWKGAVQTVLDKYQSDLSASYTKSIFVKDGIVFTCGGCSKSAQELPCYWVNNKRTELSIGDSKGYSNSGMAVAIFVQ